MSEVPLYRILFPIHPLGTSNVGSKSDPDRIQFSIKPFNYFTIFPGIKAAGKKTREFFLYKKTGDQINAN